MQASTSNDNDERQSAESCNAPLSGTVKDKVVVTFGTFDVFHVGHLNILVRARQLGSRLIVGVSTDALNMRKKNRAPLCKEQDRLAIISQLKCVDEVFYEEALEKKREYLLFHKADVLVMGDDWYGRFDEFSDICRVVYLERTPGISTTELIQAAAQVAAAQGAAEEVKQPEQ